MLDFLNRPYPFSFQPSRRIKQIVPIGFCVFLFLVLFKPFGGDVIMSAYMVFFCGSLAGLITTVIIPMLFPGYFNEAKWTLKKNLIWVVWTNIIFLIIMFLGSNIFLILRYNSSHDFTFKNFLWWFYIQVIFGVPLGIIINLANQYYLLKKHIKIATNINNSIQKELKLGLEETKQEISPNNDQNSLVFETDKYSKVKFSVNNIIYVEAVGNYLTILYREEGIKKITIRETLSNIEQKLGGAKQIYKPHRSYLVNLQDIENVTGDSQGLKVHLKNTNKLIPVSRNKIKEFKSLITTIL